MSSSKHLVAFKASQWSIQFRSKKVKKSSVARHEFVAITALLSSLWRSMNTVKPIHANEESRSAHGPTTSLQTALGCRRRTSSSIRISLPWPPVSKSTTPTALTSLQQPANSRRGFHIPTYLEGSQTSRSRSEETTPCAKQCTRCSSYMQSPQACGLAS